MQIRAEHFLLKNVWTVYLIPCPVYTINTLKKKVVQREKPQRKKWFYENNEDPNAFLLSLSDIKSSFIIEVPAFFFRRSPHLSFPNKAIHREIDRPKPNIKSFVSKWWFVWMINMLCFHHIIPLSFAFNYSF